MYLGYDENGNIVTKDPSGERGEHTRRIMGSNEMTREEMMGASRLKQKMQQQMRRLKENARKAAQARALKEADKKRQSLQTSIKNANYLKKMRFAGYGGMYHNLGGVTGSGLIPHHVSGEEIVSTFKANYGLGTSDFGSGQMGGYTPDFVKNEVKKIYAIILKIETSLKKQSDALSLLEKNKKTNTEAYRKLKKAYTEMYNAYQNTPVKAGTITYGSKRQMYVELGLKLRDVVAKTDASAAKNMALMFAAPVVYEQQVKQGMIKSTFSGYGFGSEFDQKEMGFLPILAIAGWKAVAAALAAGGTLYAIYQKAIQPDTKMDKMVEDSTSLISEALKAGQYEVAQKLTEQRGEQIKQKTEAIESSGITGQLKSATKNIGKTALIVGVGFLLIKYGLPMLQAQMAKKSQADQKPEPAQLALAGA